MITEDQNPTTAFLRDAASYGLKGPVEMMETHISRVFLVGDRVFKLKRAVKLPYVDFSTPELRLSACKKEVGLNARSTPELYLGVRAIYRGSDGVLSFEERGDLADAVVEMKRFEQENLFDHLALAGKLTTSLMNDVTEMIVSFHGETEPATHEGGAQNIAAVLDINEGGFQTSSVFSKPEQDVINRQFRDALKRHAGLLDKRAIAGKIRLCHGDLHLRNICLLDGKPRLFDCIEFNDQIATVDTLYDLAFLLMDLWHLGFEDYANLVANRYTDATGEDEGFVLLPFFMALRAAVRAHVMATQAEEAGGDAQLAADARSYYDLALRLLQEAPARLIAIGGFSGSGKTTIADQLASKVGSPPGARLIESDRIRKAMFGVLPETRLDAEAYLPEVSRRVYVQMALRSEMVLAGGGSVVADAVYDMAERRREIEDSALRAGAAFSGVWLDVSPEVLRERVNARRGGQSDADVVVLERQIERGAGGLDWRSVEASGKPEAIIGRILTLQGS